MQVWLAWLHQPGWQVAEAVATLAVLCILFARVGRTLRVGIERDPGRRPMAGGQDGVESDG